MPETIQDVQQDLKGSTAGPLKDLREAEASLRKLEEEAIGKTLNPQQIQVIEGLRSQIRHKQRVISNMERRASGKISLIEKHEAGIFGEGTDPEFINVQGKRLKELQKIYGTQIKQGQNLAEIQAKIRSGEIQKLEVKTREVVERGSQTPPLRTGEIVQEAKLREIERETIRIRTTTQPSKELSPQDRFEFNIKQAEKPIHQTISEFKPFDHGFKKEEPSAVIGLREPERLGTKRETEAKDIIGRLAIKEIDILPQPFKIFKEEEKNIALNIGLTSGIGPQFIKTISDMGKITRFSTEYAQQEKNKALSLVLIGGSTYAKTIYDLTFGIPETAIKEGPTEAILQFNPVRLAKGIQQDKILLSTTPEGRIVETLGILGGAKTGGTLTQKALGPAIKSFKRFNKDVAMKKFTENINKKYPGIPYDFRLKDNIVQQKFIEITESGLELPQFQDPLIPKSKAPIEKTTGFKIQVFEEGLITGERVVEKIDPFEQLRKPLKEPKQIEIPEAPKPVDATTTTQKKLMELQRGEYKSEFTQEFNREVLESFRKRTSLIEQFLKDERGHLSQRLKPPELVFEERFKQPEGPGPELNLQERYKLILIPMTGRITGNKLILPPIYVREQERDIFTGLRIGQDRKIKRDTRIGQELKLNLDIFKKTKLEIGEDVIREQERERDEDIFLIPAIDTRIDTIDDTIIDLEFPEEIIPKPPPKKPLILRFPDEGGTMLEEELPLFNVFAKSKGQFIKVNKKPIPKVKALNLGANVVDNTASATFKLKESNKTGIAIDDLSFRNKQKFRKKGNLYIELIRDRIDTPGEIQGITVKGWLAQRRGGLLL